VHPVGALRLPVRLRELLAGFRALARITGFFCGVARAPPAARPGNRHAERGTAMDLAKAVAGPTTSWGRSNFLHPHPRRNGSGQRNCPQRILSSAWIRLQANPAAESKHIGDVVLLSPEERPDRSLFRIWHKLIGSPSSDSVCSGTVESHFSARYSCWVQIPPAHPSFETKKPCHAARLHR